MRAVEFLSELFGPDKARHVIWNDNHHAISMLSNDTDLETRFISHGDGMYAIEFNVDGAFDMTGGGNSSEVFATVIETVRQFVQNPKNNIKGIFFTADEQSRAKMYDTISKRVAQKLGWHVLPYDDMIADPRFDTVRSYGDFVFAIEPGAAPEHRQAAQKPQHGEFMPIFYVYSREDESLPHIKVKARKSSEAEEYVIKTVPEYKGSDPFGVFATKSPLPGAKDIGTVPKPQPKPAPRQLTPLEQRLRDKLGA